MPRGRAAHTWALVLAALVVAAPPVGAQEAPEKPTRVEPTPLDIIELPAEPTPDPAATAPTQAARLDHAHDWLYLRLQRFLLDIDTQFSQAGEASLLVPASPLRLGLEGEWLHDAPGNDAALRPDIEATLRLPNIEQRLRIFISSNDLAESGSNTALDRNPVRAGLRFAPRLHLNFDLGVRLKVWPSAYAAVRWAPDFQVGSVGFQPFIKPYLESGVGLGASGGIAIEHRREHWFLRSASYLNWTRNTAATQWSQSLLFGHAQAIIAEGRYDRIASGHDLACGTALHALATGDRLAGASAYELSLIRKRPLRGGWLYGYVEPLVRWERITDWHPEAGIRIGLDALFWGFASTSEHVVSGCG